MASEQSLVLPVRRGRNAVALVGLIALWGAARWVAYQERATLGQGHWWVAVFPLLMLVTAYRQVRPRAAGLLLVELKNSERWAEERPWLVRANERRMNAAVIQRLRELAGRPEHIISQVKAVAPVRLHAPTGLRLSA